MFPKETAPGKKLNWGREWSSPTAKKQDRESKVMKLQTPKEVKGTRGGVPRGPEKGSQPRKFRSSSCVRVASEF